MRMKCIAVVFLLLRGREGDSVGRLCLVFNMFSMDMTGKEFAYYHAVLLKYKVKE
jgi:hypothetical protein